MACRRRHFCSTSYQTSVNTSEGERVEGRSCGRVLSQGQVLGACVVPLAAPGAAGRGDCSMVGLLQFKRGQVADPGSKPWHRGGEETTGCVRPTIDSQHRVENVIATALAPPLVETPTGVPAPWPAGRRRPFDHPPDLAPAPPAVESGHHLQGSTVVSDWWTSAPLDRVLLELEREFSGALF